jgi:hypothetical protein
VQTRLRSKKNEILASIYLKVTMWILGKFILRILKVVLPRKKKLKKKDSSRRYLRIQDIVIGTVRRHPVFYDAVVKYGESVSECLRLSRV